MRRLLLAAFTVALFPLLLRPTLALGAPSIRRLALIVAANDGGDGRARLRFAHKDAETFATVLHELGGVLPGDAIVVSGATRQSLETGVEELRRKLARSAGNGERLEAILYYSGHSNEDGLLLGRDMLRYADLKTMMTTLPVDVRLMVLDSCASGHLTLSKGGARKPAFLLDASTKAQGHAIITSSSSDEAAQESARIGGSFFTHYLVSGLRGAADVNVDGRVTLNEAYQYAYVETLARTEKTLGGPQHPAYDFKLAGTGDLVLTDLRESSALVTFPAALHGRFFLRGDGGQLIAEVNKPAGRAMELGVEPGSYRVVWERDGRRSEAGFTLKAGDKLDAAKLAFATVEGEQTALRGGKVYRTVPASFMLIPPLGDWDQMESDERHHFAFGLLAGHSGRVDGLSLSLLAHLVDEGGVTGGMVTFGVNFDRGSLTGFQTSFLGNYVGGDVTGVQASGITNVAAGHVDGLQASYMLNIARGEVKGAQVAIANLAPAVTGLQAGLVNVATRASDVQLGLVNVTGDGSVVQAGLVNYAGRVAGTQIGLVNVSHESDGVPIGLVSIVKDGRRDVDLWGDEEGFAHLSFKMGSRNVYTIYDVAYRDGEKARAGLGLGFLYGQAKEQPWWVAAEGITHGIIDEDESRTHGENEDEEDRPKRVLVRGQIAAGWRIAHALSVFGGPTYAVDVTRHTKDETPGHDRRTVKRRAGGHGGLKLEL